MNEEEFKKYVNEMNKNIHEKLKDNKDELDFYEEVVIQFNNVCQERNDLEQALDEILDVINGHMPNEYALCKAMDEIEHIISKAKGNDE